VAHTSAAHFCVLRRESPSGVLARDSSRRPSSGVFIPAFARDCARVDNRDLAKSPVNPYQGITGGKRNKSIGARAVDALDYRVHSLGHGIARMALYVLSNGRAVDIAPRTLRSMAWFFRPCEHVFGIDTVIFTPENYRYRGRQRSPGHGVPCAPSNLRMPIMPVCRLLIGMSDSA
jgi:hypothetical protein